MSDRNGALRILRQQDGRWLFDSRSLAQLPDIIGELQDSKRVTGEESEQHLHLRIRQRLPDSLTQRAFLLDNWLWLALLIIIGAGVLVDKLGSLLLRALVHHWRVRTRTRAFADLPDNMLRPSGLMAMAMLLWIGINLIGLPEQAQTGSRWTTSMVPWNRSASAAPAYAPSTSVYGMS